MVLGLHCTPQLMTLSLTAWGNPTLMALLILENPPFERSYGAK